MKVTLTAPAHIAGQLRSPFKALGYFEDWKAGTWRDLPPGFIRRLTADGCPVVMAMPEDLESDHYYIAPEREEQGNRELLALWRLKFSHEPKIEIYFTEGTPVDGNMRIRFLAAGYKGQKVYKGQLLTLPVSFVKALAISGYPFTTEIQPVMRESNQARFTETALRVSENWPEEPPEPPSVEVMKEELKIVETELKTLLKEPSYRQNQGEVEFAEAKFRNLSEQIKAAEKKKTEEKGWPKKWLELREITEQEITGE